MIGIGLFVVPGSTNAQDPPVLDLTFTFLRTTWAGEYPEILPYTIGEEGILDFQLHGNPTNVTLKFILPEELQILSRNVTSSYHRTVVEGQNFTESYFDYEGFSFEWGQIWFKILDVPTSMIRVKVYYTDVLLSVFSLPVNVTPLLVNVYQKPAQVNPGQGFTLYINVTNIANFSVHDVEIRFWMDEFPPEMRFQIQDGPYPDPRYTEGIQYIGTMNPGDGRIAAWEFEIIKYPFSAPLRFSVYANESDSIPLKYLPEVGWVECDPMPELAWQGLILVVGIFIGFSIGRGKKWLKNEEKHTE
jgi:hypothetical protein